MGKFERVSFLAEHDEQSTLSASSWPGFVPAIHVFDAREESKTWMAALPGAKMRFALLRGHD